MNLRPTQGKSSPPTKPPRAAESFNFFQGCSASTQPEWATGICKFKLIRRRPSRSKGKG
jgi:hypothetical protein